MLPVLQKGTAQSVVFICSTTWPYTKHRPMLRCAVRGLSLRTGSLPKPCPLCRRKRGKSFTFTFSGVTHGRKSGNYTDDAGVRHGIIYIVPCKCYMKKWRWFSVRNPKLVPYETIVRATSGEPEAVDEVLRHYGKRIRLASLENG